MPPADKDLRLSDGDAASVSDAEVASRYQKLRAKALAEEEQAVSVTSDKDGQKVLDAALFLTSLIL